MKKAISGILNVLAAIVMMIVSTISMIIAIAVILPIGAVIASIICDTPLLETYFELLKEYHKGWVKNFSD